MRLAFSACHAAVMLVRWVPLLALVFLLMYVPRSVIALEGPNAITLSQVSTALGETLTDVATVGTFAYITTSHGLLLAGVADPSHVRILSYLDLGRATVGVDVAAGFAYVALDTAGLSIVSVGDPSAPAEVARLATNDRAREVFVAGSYAFVADMNYLTIINVGNPHSPQLVGKYDTPASALDVEVGGTYAYVAAGSGGLQIIDVSIPSSPAFVASHPTPSPAVSLSLGGARVYVAEGRSGFQIFDISNAANPQLVGSDASPDSTTQIIAAGDFAYVADDDSLRVFHVANPAFIVPEGIAGVTCSRLALSGTQCYVVSAGILSAVDIANTSAPLVVWDYRPQGAVRDVVVAGEYAILAGDRVRFVSISDPQAPYVASEVVTANMTSGLDVLGNYCYIADRGAGLKIIDISDPRSPQLIGGVDTPNDAFRVDVFGTTAYIAALTAVDIVDVSTPTAPAFVKSVTTPGSPRDVWMDQTGSILYVTDPGAGLSIIQVPSPAAASYLKSRVLMGDEETLALNAGEAYVTSGNNGIAVVDLSLPIDPDFIAVHRTVGYAFGLFLHGSLGSIINLGGQVETIDISNPLVPVRVARDSLPEAGFAICVADPFVYIAGDTRLHILRLSGTTAIGEAKPENTSSAGVWIRPNPFNVETEISFLSSTPCIPTVDIYDVLGRHVARLANKVVAAGRNHVLWNGKASDASPVGSGVYLIVVDIGTAKYVTKAVLLK